MINLTETTATPSDRPAPTPGIMVGSVHIEPAPGIFASVNLHDNCLVITNGTESLLVSMEELVALAQAHRILPELPKSEPPLPGRLTYKIPRTA
jgi:hypothetical protein